jgi:membrane protease YdiL (CAAX protease family)
MRTGVAFVLLYFVFDRLAAALGSTRGEAGVVVAAVVIALAVLAELWLTRAPVRSCCAALGFGAPASRALLAAVALSAMLLAFIPLLAVATGATLELRDGAAWLALGMFVQGGVAEEVLFRGFMYRHLRRTRTFWRAATLSAVPFAVAHVPLFWSLDAPVALLALGMAIAWSFPLAWLFDRAGGSIWPGAILHAVMQAGVKVLVDDDPTFQQLALAWVALGLAAPWLFFLLRPVSERAAASTLPRP